MECIDPTGGTKIVLRKTFVELIESQVLQGRKQRKLIFGDAINDSALLGANGTVTANRIIWIERHLKSNFTAMTRSLVSSLHRKSEELTRLLCSGGFPEIRSARCPTEIANR